MRYFVHKTLCLENAIYCIQHSLYFSECHKIIFIKSSVVAVWTENCWLEVPQMVLVIQQYLGYDL
jgi:hypothetical protein